MARLFDKLKQLSFKVLYNGITYWTPVYVRFPFSSNYHQSFLFHAPYMNLTSITQYAHLNDYFNVFWVVFFLEGVGWVGSYDLNY